MLWPGSPVVDVVEIIEVRAAAEAARPVIQLTRKVSLVRFFLVKRSLLFTRKEALVREESLVWLRGGLARRRQWPPRERWASSSHQ